MSIIFNEICINEEMLHITTHEQDGKHNKPLKSNQSKLFAQNIHVNFSTKANITL